MSLVSGVGFSEHRNPAQAGREAAERAMQQANTSHVDFVFLFGTVGYRQEPLLKAVREATGAAPLSGCSGEGVIVPGAVHETNFGVVVCVVASDEIHFTNGCASGMGTDPLTMGRTIGAKLALDRSSDALVLMVLADGLTLNFDAMLRGLMDRCPSQHAIPLIGGTASDNWTFTKTYQYCDDRILTDGAVGTLIQGNARCITAARHGCVPIGEELIITRSEGNRILEINGRRALDVIDEFLTIEERGSDWKKTNVYLALGVTAPEYMKSYDDYLIRFMPMRDESTGGVYVPTELAAGTRCHMTRRDHQKISEGNARLATEIRTALDGKDPRFVLQIECTGRGQVIFNDTEKQALLRELQTEAASLDAPWFGLYTYGEFGPVGGVNCFHNYSVVVTAIA